MKRFVQKMDLPPPKIVSEETRAALLKREKEEVSGVREMPQEERSGDRAEYVAPTEPKPARLPDVTHEEKIQIREQTIAADQKRSAEIAEQIRGEDKTTRFEQSAQKSIEYTDAVLAPLKEFSTEQALLPETIEASRKKLTVLLDYLRENLQREGLALDQKNPVVRKQMEEIHYRIVNIGQMIYHLDTLMRREEMKKRYAGGAYELKPIQPKEIPNAELEAMAKKWKQKPPEPTRWSKMKGMWKSFWK